MSEKEFQKAVIDCAKLYGWLVHHTRPAWSKKGWRTPIQGDKGFPDLVLARKGRTTLHVELKAEGGKPTEDQLRWAAALTGYALWWPKDWHSGMIEQALR